MKASVEQPVKSAFVKIEKNAFKVFSGWIRILLDFELSKVVPFIKSRKTRWGHYVCVNDGHNCIAFLLYLVHTNVYELGETTG